MHKKEGKEEHAEKEIYLKWFSELGNKDINIAGGKGASLAEMSNNQFPIPPGFIITAGAYRHFIEHGALEDKIKDLIDNCDVENTKELEKTSKKVRALIEDAKMPKDLEDEIIEAYDILDANKHNITDAKGSALEILRKSHEPPFVAVRSSATTEDLADASFAGQQDSFLNVKGNTQLIKKVKQCISSLFTARAIYYRSKKGFAHTKAYLAVVVQKMIDSDKSGVMFSKNPIKNDNTIVIEAVWGLGEGIVSGQIKPDNYVLANEEEMKMKDIYIADKKTAVVRNSAGETVTVKLTEERSKQQVLNDHEIRVLAQYALRLEEHYGKPQDIEFAISGKDIFIVQSRPITTKAQESKDDIEGEVLLKGLGASPGVAFGTVKIIHNLEELDKVQKGDVLVTEMTNPDMVVSMQRAAGIITDEGGITSHAAIVSREMGIPAVVGTSEATKLLKDGQMVTVDGNNGKVFNGKGEAKEVIIEPIVETKTKIKVIVDLPDYAERAARSHAKGVGLVRLEGIIAELGKHPYYFVKAKKMNDYTEGIYAGLKKIAGFFDEVWIRTSDIRTDEYRHLEGAPEKVEGNPMLGDHGIRFSLKHKEIIRAEISAVRLLASEFKNKKFGIMVPQLIMLEELQETKKIANEIGMLNNMKIGIMVETPAAVQIINDLCEEGMQFISFGTNDLTQYTLAIDRNNENIQDLYNEMNPAVLNSIRYVIRRCKKYGVETSICGQAASKEEMIKFLIQEGIDSVSVNADAAGKISRLIASIEGGSTGGIGKVIGNVVSYFKPKEKVVEKMENPTTLNALTIGNDKELIPEIPNEIVMEELGDNIMKKMENMAFAEIENKDIEEIVLGELEKDEYSPGMQDKKGDIPKLNDAIPIDSNIFD